MESFRDLTLRTVDVYNCSRSRGATAKLRILNELSGFKVFAAPPASLSTAQRTSYSNSSSFQTEAWLSKAIQLWGRRRLEFNTL